MKPMKKSVLGAALMGGTVLAHAASAADLDDRWYLSGTVGANVQDGNRGTDNAPSLGMGLGKAISPHWSMDLDLNYQNPHFKRDRDVKWQQAGASLDLRRHFMADERTVNPYLLIGAGVQRIKEGDLTSPGTTRSARTTSAKVGIGLQTDINNRQAGVRTEVAYRRDFDEKHAGRTQDSFDDVLASVSLILPLGRAETIPPPRPMPAPQINSSASVSNSPPPIAPRTPNCADLDDDGDGINNCNDSCPNTPAGQPVGADGCPIQITVDLNGVNFDFNQSVLRADAVAVLDEAIAILKRYPDLQVEVAGHTDAVGGNAVNQRLSEQRARAVYTYLVNHGITASRLIGPRGYGKTRPIAPNTTPAGRAQNRRTELNIQELNAGRN